MKICSYIHRGTHGNYIYLMQSNCVYSLGHVFYIILFYAKNNNKIPQQNNYTFYSLQ